MLLKTYWPYEAVLFPHIKLIALSNLYSGTHSRVGRKLGESSLFLRISLHLLTVSKSRKVSPTLNSVARQRAISLRVGGPGDSWMCCVSCSTSFFWQPLMSDCKKTRCFKNYYMKCYVVWYQTYTLTTWAYDHSVWAVQGPAATGWLHCTGWLKSQNREQLPLLNFSWISSVPPTKCQDNISQQVTNASLYLSSNSSFTSHCNNLC
jgi:hypothetical protein